LGPREAYPDVVAAIESRRAEIFHSESFPRIQAALLTAGNGMPSAEFLDRVRLDVAMRRDLSPGEVESLTLLDVLGTLGL
jgi:hypothetical protein